MHQPHGGGGGSGRHNICIRQGRLEEAGSHFYTAVEAAAQAVETVLDFHAPSGILRHAKAPVADNPSLIPHVGPAPNLGKAAAIQAAKQLAHSTDSILMSLRDKATSITRKLAAEDLAAGVPMTPQVFGNINDAIFKGLVRDAIDNGSLPPTLRVGPAPSRLADLPVSQQPVIDVWDSATGVGWDLTTATVKSVVDHERYIDRVMPDGTTIGDVRPLVYTR